MPWWDCGRSSPWAAPAPYLGSLLDPTRWVTQYSPGTPSQPSAAEGGWSIDIPATPASIHYLVAAINRPLTKGFTASFRVDATPDAVFNSKIAENNQADGGMPPGICFYFQRQGDDMSGAGEYEFYRWFGLADRFEFVNGHAVIIAPFEPARWTSVMGKKGDVTPAQFAAALANIGNIGITFGGGSFAGHGVNMIAGTAKLVVTQFDIA